MIRVGVIGYGYWGPNLVRNFAEAPGSQVVAVCDLRRERLVLARSRYPGSVRVHPRPFQHRMNVVRDMAVHTPPFEGRVEADVVAVCERNRIPVVNVRPVLGLALVSGDEVLQQVYCETDSHLGIIGNHLVGQVVYG